MKKIVAKARFIKGSPRKVRYVADAVRGLEVARAIQTLKVLPQRAAKAVLKVYQQAVGNAKVAAVSPADLVVESLQIHEGPRFKRRDVHAHGARFNSGIRHKKMAHITLILSDKKEAHGTKS